MIGCGRDMVRAGLRMILEAADGVEVVATAADGSTAVDETLRLIPDVCLLDLDLPGLDAIEATRRVVEGTGTSGPRVVVLAADDPGDQTWPILAAGAIGVVSRESGPELLVEAVRAAAGNQSLLSPPIATRLLRLLRPSGGAASRHPAGPGDRSSPEGEWPEPPAGGPLTDREEQVLVSVAEGMTNAEIAQCLHLSVSTVKSHLATLMGKLGARNRVELARWAFRTGRVS